MYIKNLKNKIFNMKIKIEKILFIISVMYKNWEKISHIWNFKHPKFLVCKKTLRKYFTYPKF